MGVSELSNIFLEGMLIRWICILKFLENSLLRIHRQLWRRKCPVGKDFLLVDPPLSKASIRSSAILPELVFTSYNSSFYTFTDYIIHYVPESNSHRLMRSQKLRHKLRIQDLNLDFPGKKEFNSSPIPNGAFEDDEFHELSSDSKPFIYECDNSPGKVVHVPNSTVRGSGTNSPSKVSPTPYRSPRKSAKVAHKSKNNIKKESNDLELVGDTLGLPEFPHLHRDPITRKCQPTTVPSFLLHTCSKADSIQRELYASDRSSAYESLSSVLSEPSLESCALLYGSKQFELDWTARNSRIRPPELGGFYGLKKISGWNQIIIPDKHTLIMDAGKLYVLDSLLSRLKAGDHRVLIYSQMTKMIDLLEEYMWHRKHKYMRLDGSSKISERRDMVEDFQNKSDIFVFLLSTRAGGVGINLTAADTVIFYDSDWNPTVDQQAMDRAHRLGQTKQVTVFRLICKGTIEERILQRAREKSEIQRMVISGGNFKPDTLKPKEVVSLLLDADIEREYRAKQSERRAMEDHKLEINREKMRERMRKRYLEKKWEKEQVEKKRRLEEDLCEIDVCGDQTLNSNTPSPTLSEGSQFGVSLCGTDDGSSDALQIVDIETTPSAANTGATFPTFSNLISDQNSPSLTTTPHRRQRKRGRPRGSGARGRGSRGGSGEDTGTHVSNGTLTPHDNGQVLNGEGNSSALLASNSAMTTSGNGSSRELKRGRGRPRLLPLGPGHQGTRPPPALPVALGSTLGSNLTNASQQDRKHSSYHFKS